MNLPIAASDESNALGSTVLLAQDLLSGSQLTHEITIPAAILHPQAIGEEETARSERSRGEIVRLRPLNLATMTLISRATRDDSSLVPILMIKEAIVEPVLSVDQIRQMHIGLVHYLVRQINLISGLGADGETLDAAVNSSLGQTHLLLAKHFGWTPQQVSQLTPGQVAVYLAGIERLLDLDREAQS